jgi:hypothetical protein
MLLLSGGLHIWFITPDAYLCYDSDVPKNVFHCVLMRNAIFYVNYKFDMLILTFDALSRIVVLFCYLCRNCKVLNSFLTTYNLLAYR